MNNMNDKKMPKNKVLLALGIILAVIGPLLLVICPMISSSYGYNMLSTSSTISASAPHFSEISKAIMYWWLGLGLTIFGLPIGIILIVWQNKRK